MDENIEGLLQDVLERPLWNTDGNANRAGIEIKKSDRNFCSMCTYIIAVKALKRSEYNLYIEMAEDEDHG